MKVAQANSLNERFQDVCILSRQMKIFQDWKKTNPMKRSITNLGETFASFDQVSFDPSQLAFEVRNAFSLEGVDCVVGGSLVVMAYTLPQMTKDVDFNIDLRSSDPHDQRKSLREERLGVRALS